MATAMMAMAVVAALAPSTAPARAGARCNLRGHNLVASRLIKVVRVVGETRVRLLGCARPSGKVRTLADLEYGELDVARASVPKWAGTWVIVSLSESNQYASSTGLRAVNVRTGKGYQVSSSQAPIAEPPQIDISLSAYAINERGFTAAVGSNVVPVAGTTTATPTNRKVVLWSPGGSHRDLDTVPAASIADIDPASLILDTHTVLWTHAGAVRFARF